MKRSLAVTAIAATALVANAGAAQTAYVIDKLLVGVHEEKSLDSEIVKVLPTGTELEVLERDGELARVRDPSGDTGWVDAAYLMNERPAALLVEELSEKNRTLENELHAARARIAALEDAAGTNRGGQGAGGAALDELAELQRKLASERLRSAELQAKLSAQQEAASRQASAGAALERLQRENAELRTQVEALLAGEPGNPHAAAGAWREIRGLGYRLLHSQTLTIVLLLALAAAFGAGLYCMDAIQRRRHGGFRV